MSDLSRDVQVTQGPAVQMEGGQDMTSTINQAGQVVDDTRMSLKEIEALEARGTADKAASEAESAESAEEKARKEGFARELGVANRKGSRDQKRIAALTAAYAAIEAGVPVAFVRQGLRSLDLRESKEDRIRRRTAEDKAEQERLQQRRDIKAEQKKKAEESRAAMKERNAKLREERLAKIEKRKAEKGIPPKEKTDPLNLGVDVDADPKTTPPVEGDASFTPGQARTEIARGREQLGNAINDVERSVNMARLDAIRNDPALTDVLERYDPNFKGPRSEEARRFREQVGLDRPTQLTDPVDLDAENRMMMADILDFGPTPAASGPVAEPRQAAPPARPLTPSERLDAGLKNRPGSKAPGAVGSAPNMIDSLGFEAPSGNGFGDPAASAASQAYYDSLPPRITLEGIREGVQDLRGRLRSGQAAQREMMAPITDQIGTFDIDETLENLQSEADDLGKKKKVMDLQGKVDGLKKDLAKGQRGSGVPVDHGFRQSFDQSVRQPLRDLLGMG